MRVAVLAPVCLVLAACGGGSADDAGAIDASPDATLPCGPDLCTAIGATCGSTVDSCGNPVDCGQCTWTPETVAAHGERPAIDVSDQVRIAYVDTSNGNFQVRLAERGANGWTSEPVADLGGEPAGPVDLAVTPTHVRFITFVDEASQIHVAWAAPGSPWTVEGPLAAGVAAAIAIDPDGLPVMAIAGVINTTTGIFVVTRPASQWTASLVGEPTAGGAPQSLALAVEPGQIDLAWRDPSADVVRFASGHGTAYPVEIVDPAAPAPRDPGALSLALDDGGRPHVLHGRADALIAAARTGGAWHDNPLPLDGGDGDNALASGTGVLHAAVFHQAGLRLLDGVAGVWLGQDLPNHCSDGTVDLAVALDGSEHVVDSCGTIEYLTRPPPTP